MNSSVVDLTVIVGAVALFGAFVSGLFVGARLTRSNGSRAGDRPLAKAEVIELALQLLREALAVVRELRRDTAAPDQAGLPASEGPGQPRSRSGTKVCLKAKEEGVDMRHGLGPVVGRVVVIIGGLLLVGLVLRLIAAMLSPVLPAGLMHILTAGWNLLFGMLGPALPAIVAVIILGAAVWVFVGRHR